MLAALMALMIMAGGCLHSLPGLLLQQLHAVHHPQRPALEVDVVQNGVHPVVRLAPQVHKEVAVPHCQDVRGGGLVGVALRPRGQQQRHLGQVSGGGAGEVVGREDGGYNLELLHPSRLPPRRGAARQKKSAQQRQDGDSSQCQSLFQI